MEAKQPSASTKRRFIVKRQKDAMTKGVKELKELYPNSPHILRLFALKLLRDYKSVASKRGTKNFDAERWLDLNINPKQNDKRLQSAPGQKSFEGSNNTGSN